MCVDLGVEKYLRHILTASVSHWNKKQEDQLRVGLDMLEKKWLLYTVSEWINLGMDEHAGSAKGSFEGCDHNLKWGLWILERKGR